MTYTLELSREVEIDIAKHKKSGDKNLVIKIFALFQELESHPLTGTGHPEPLRYQGTNMWSRRIDKKHRLVYEIKDDELIVIAISAYGHYTDK